MSNSAARPDWRNHTAAVRCVRCGGDIEAGARFCRHCGLAISLREAPREVSGAVATNAARSVEGEHKQVTLLFADLQGSTALSTRFEPEDWHRIIGGFFAILAEGVRRFAGTISRFTGDGIVALFGAPLAQEDHALRACRAALHAHAGLMRYAAELRRSHGLNFSARMGLNSGDVVAATIGNDLGTGYTAVGHTVTLAARLEQLAEPGKIFLTEATARQVEGYADVRDLGEFEIPGLAAPVRVFELCGAGTYRARLDRARARGFSPFVGRTPELGQLEAALGRALEGQGQVVHVIGDAGVGKSRLCHEFLARCRSRGVRAIKAQVGAHLESIPFLTFAEDFRHYAGVDAHDDAAQVRAKVGRLLELGGEELRDFVPLLHDVLSVADPGAPRRRNDPLALESELQRLTDSLVRLMVRSGPTVVLVEDLQWIDPGSAAMLATLVAVAPQLPLLVVLSRRPQAAVDLRALDSGERLDLAPLAPGVASELLQGLLGPGEDIAPLAQRIRKRSRGNPYFIEEIVQSLAEARVLDGERGAYRLVGPVDEVRLPATLQTVIAARIDRLAPRDKAILQTAAVIGRSFSSSFLREVTGLDESALAICLRRLAAAEFLTIESEAAGETCAFAHPLVHEVSYTTQLADGRARAHRQVARVVMERAESRWEESAALVSHHLERAGEQEMATDWARRAAMFAEARGASEAQRAWQRVRTLVPPQPTSQTMLAIGVEARARLLQLGARVGFEDESEAARLFGEGEGLARELAEPREAARLSGAYAEVCATSGELDRATALARRGLALAPQIDDIDLVRRLQAGFVFTEFMRGQFGVARRAAEGFLWLWPAAPGGHHLAHPLDCYLVLFHAMAGAEMGFIAEARRSIALVLREAEGLDSPEAACLAHAFSPVVVQLAGDDPAHSVRDGRAALALAERIGSPLATAMARWGLGVAERLSGNAAAAVDALEASLAAARERSIAVQAEGGILSALSEALLDQGRGEEALHSAQRALAVAAARGTRFFGFLARITLARTLLTLHGAARANQIDELLHAAGMMIDAEGLRGRDPELRALRSQLAALRGDFAGAQSELVAAQRCCVEIGAEGHARRLEARLDLGAVA